MMKEFGLLGRRLSHSLSPQIHAHFGNYAYDLIEQEPEELQPFFSECPYKGINVTIPYKTAVIPYCERLNDTAARIGSVNTICFEQGETIGYNTDYFGFRYLLEKNNISIAGRKVVVLGSGGASQTVCCVLQDMQAAQIVVVSRNGQDHYENLDRHYDADVIVNTTPVGMYPNNLQSPIDLQNFKNCRAMVDLIYNPLRTKLLLNAEQLQMQAVNGLEMLVAQGKQAAELFLKSPIPDDKIQETVAAMQRDFVSIVLVGMPGCGKTTIGKRLAAHFEKPFIDTDEVVIKNEGCAIPEIFAEKGEAAFRVMETEAILQATKQLGCVIATGGGAVLGEINRMALRQNARVVFLNRSIDRLATGGRPLSKDAEALSAIYAARLPLYRAVSDFEIDANTNPATTCKRILEALENENSCY